MPKVVLSENAVKLIEAGEPVTYVARLAPKLKIKIRDVMRQFENCSLVLDDMADVREMETLLADPTKQAVSQHITRLDRDAALIISKQHQEEMRRQNASAKGGVSSETIRALAHKQLENRDQALSSQSPEQVAAMQAEINDDLQLTEKARLDGVDTVGEQGSVADEGFTPTDPVVELPADDTGEGLENPTSEDALMNLMAGVKPK